MRRREFIAGLGSTAVWPLAARAQQRTMPVIGYLSVGPPDTGRVEDWRAGLGRSRNAVVASFLAGLAETGYVEGRNFVLEVWSTEDNDRLPALAADLVRRRVAMIFAASAPPTFAAKSATTVIPIVSAMGGADPVEDGLVASLNR